MAILLMNYASAYEGEEGNGWMSEYVLAYKNMNEALSKRMRVSA